MEICKCGNGFVHGILLTYRTRTAPSLAPQMKKNNEETNSVKENKARAR